MTDQRTLQVIHDNNLINSAPQETFNQTDNFPISRPKAIDKGNPVTSSCVDDNLTDIQFYTQQFRSDMSRKTIHNRSRIYHPDELRSHPFQFINLPIYLVAITSFYWIVLCPFLYAFFSINFATFPSLTLLYFVSALILYLFIVAVFVFVWRCKIRKGPKYTYYSQRDIEAPTFTAKDALYSPSEEPYVPRQKPPPIKMPVDDYRPLSQNLSSPLTPRELFLFDLIETALKSDREASREFIERERENCLADRPSERVVEEKREFFIANAEVKEACVTQAFLFVEEVKVEECGGYEVVALID